MQVENAANEKDEPMQFYLLDKLQQLRASNSSCYFASLLSETEYPSSSTDKLLVFISVS